jgi:hypothetical protein
MRVFSMSTYTRGVTTDYCIVVIFFRRNTSVFVFKTFPVYAVCITVMYFFKKPASELLVRFRVSTEASMKFRVFWNETPCSLAGVNRRFRGAYCLHHQGDDEGSTHL